ncbi:mechanosensitive ion channel family protein [Asticcacaulis tiandongensis]|uniref:mechanosensitive ion channel family protein n=1 Tax=Asticcacaulis tiandongensis TaxID=2565365 RepID=UPI00112DA219|nr:mechanosensitive ion channel family protein [Asticcacaulis tiandongensis]
MTFQSLNAALSDLQPWMQSLIGMAVLLLIALGSHIILKFVILRTLKNLFGVFVRTSHSDLVGRMVSRLANILPAIIIARGIEWIAHLPEGVVTVVNNVCTAFIVVSMSMALGSLLDIFNLLYQKRPEAATKPIKGYIEVVKIAIYSIAAILMIAVLIDKSPLLLLSGLGAIAAVLMLVFKDTLLSLVASVQINANDILRVGDWVEMPQLNADGFVIDVALHTIKIQNWDKTITTVPTQRFISDSFKNWRGMFESGGRRIKRSLFIDQRSIKFLNEEEIARLRRFALIDDYLDEKSRELDDYNLRLTEAGRDPVNTRRVTNIGTFRAYIQAYLKSHPQIHQDMLLLVRQLQPTSQGLPLEIYCFTSETAWVLHETIQADIFDHLLATIDKFDLKLFQELSDSSFLKSEAD